MSKSRKTSWCNIMCVLHFFGVLTISMQNSNIHAVFFTFQDLFVTALSPPNMISPKSRFLFSYSVTHSRCQGDLLPNDRALFKVPHQLAIDFDECFDTKGD